MQIAGLQPQRVWSPRPERNPELVCLTSFWMSLMLLVWDPHFSNYPSKVSGVFSFPSWSGCDILACFNLLPQEQNLTRGYRLKLFTGTWSWESGKHRVGVMVWEGKQRRPPRASEGSVSPRATGSYCCCRPLRGLRIHLLRIWRPGFLFLSLTRLRLLLRIQTLAFPAWPTHRLSTPPRWLSGSEMCFPEAEARAQMGFAQ